MAGEGFARQMIDSMKANRAALSRGTSKIFGFSGKKGPKVDLTSKNKMSPEEFKKFSEQLQNESRRRRKVQIIVGVSALLTFLVFLFIMLQKMR